MVMIYQAILLFILGVAIWTAIDDDDVYLQATAALVAIPLFLRLAMIK
jgi:hypothetical protein